MNPQEIIFDHFIAPLQKPRASYIGIEIEMPVVNLSGEKTDKAVFIEAVTKAIRHFGFTPHKFDAVGYPCKLLPVGRNAAIQLFSFLIQRFYQIQKPRIFTFGAGLAKLRLAYQPPALHFSCLRWILFQPRKALRNGNNRIRFNSLRKRGLLE